GRELRKPEAVGELLVAHPVHHVDRDAVHFRNDRGAAADGKHRERCERRGQFGEYVPAHAGPRFSQAMAMLTGVSTTNTTGSGKRRIATPTKAASTTMGAQPSLANSGAAILATMAINSPTAAALTPVSIRPRAVRSPNLA